MPARIFFLIALYLFTVAPAHSAALPTEKRELIDAMLEIGGTEKLVDLMAANLTRQILIAMSKKTEAPVNRPFAAIVTKEVKKAMYEDFVLNNRLNDIFYDLYDEYFTTSQLREIVDFQLSPTGRRMTNALPKISKRSMAAAKEHAASIASKVQSRLMSRLDDIEDEIKVIEENAAKEEQN